MNKLPKHTAAHFITLKILDRLVRLGSTSLGAGDSFADLLLADVTQNFIRRLGWFTEIS